MQSAHLIINLDVYSINVIYFKKKNLLKKNKKYFFLQI